MTDKQRIAKLIEEVEAAQHEADRLRHGVPIEGDFVCPESLRADDWQRLADQRAAALVAAEAEIARLQEHTTNCREKRYELAKENARLRAALKRYGQCEFGCCYREESEPCRCGFEAAISQ